MDVKACLLVLMCVSYGWCAVIIPEELPSLLSVAYSNIPPIKKGTDSRVGFGYAFGNHADFQVLLEFGPQTNTLNLTGQPFGASAPSNNKRQAPSHPTVKLTKNKNKEKYLSEPSKYLHTWAQKMKQPTKSAPTSPSAPGRVPNLEDSVVELVKNDKGEFEINQPRPGNMPQKVLQELKRLYGEKRQEAMKLGESRTEEEVKKITEDLSNVDLD